MSNSMIRTMIRHRRPSARLAAVVLSVLLAAALPAGRTAGAQPAARATPPGTSPDLQGLWDFTMRVGERTSTGFFALGPVDRGWAGSITPDSTNTLAIRTLTVHGDSVRMVVASREGDVLFRARLTDDARAMEGIVEYHGGALLPMTATRRARRAVP